MTNDSAPTPEGWESALEVRGARTHNLRNVSVDVPHGRLVVVSGPSGSGKSSLVFDTILAEGRRQFLQGLSLAARQRLSDWPRADVDSIEGLPPTIAVDQEPARRNARSTVGTMTEIYDYLRLLFARCGVAECPQCCLPVKPLRPRKIVERLSSMEEGTKLMLLAPLVANHKGGLGEQLQQVRKSGLVRVRIDGAIHDLESLPTVDAQAPHDLDVVVDRLIARPGFESRLAESIRLALKHGQGNVVALVQQGATWEETRFSTLPGCPQCGWEMPELEPRLFSFNSPFGACPGCEGLGTKTGFVPELIIPERTLSLNAGAVVPWRELSAEELEKKLHHLLPLVEDLGQAPGTPLSDWEPDQIEGLLLGRDGHLGLLAHLEMDWSAARRKKERERLAEYRRELICTDCGGIRLRPEARAVRLAGLSIGDAVSLSASSLAERLAQLVLGDELMTIAAPLLAEMTSRLRFMRRVGLGYLSLHRSANSLSGGESQRTRLVTALGSGLSGVMYLLDEPSIGLHPRDNLRLIETLEELREAGNSLLVVEHDEAFLEKADWLIDVGPGAGPYGGRIVAEGPPSRLLGNGETGTGKWLSAPTAPRKDKVTRSRQQSDGELSSAIQLTGARHHNLKNVDITIPLARLTVVTGVSGSGKSSLILDTLGAALARRLHGAQQLVGAYEELVVDPAVTRCVSMDQRGIGRTPRSNPATYTGIFDEIRKVFAKMKLSRQRGFSASRFSTNVRGGRCEECQGLGFRQLEASFLPEFYAECPICQGRRFNPQTLAVTYRDHTIADVLALSVDQAVDLFDSHAGILRTLQRLQQVGLGYLSLGQPALTLSGGESQRIKLAEALGRAEPAGTLFILDEPTTGLHVGDVQRLLNLFDMLTAGQGTVVVIEHNLDVIGHADWVIDVGPDGGDRGGEIVAAGRPATIAENSASQTGRFLREKWAREGSLTSLPHTVDS